VFVYVSACVDQDNDNKMLSHFCDKFIRSDTSFDKGWLNVDFVGSVQRSES
jgi:hypothetical protein